jgi:membrane protease YdiL (CAAX protease family)
LSHQITYANPWVRRVDEARRKTPGIAALLIAIVGLGVSMTGGVALYGVLASPALAPALDRALQYLCVEGPLYLVAIAGLVAEARGRIAANAGPATAGAIGFGQGLAAFGLAVALSALFGAVRAAPDAAAPLAHRLAGFAIGAGLIGFQAFGEELLFRGWLQPDLAARWGPGVGVALTSVLFAAAHAFGRPIGALALINDTLAGVWFGFLAFRSGGLIAPFAAHFAWNWTEASILGLTPNPGVDPLGSLFDLDLVGPGLFSGGADEMNGAIGATLALAAAIAMTLAWRPGRQKAATP